MSSVRALGTSRPLRNAVFNLSSTAVRTYPKCNWIRSLSIRTIAPNPCFSLLLRSTPASSVGSSTVEWNAIHREKQTFFEHGTEFRRQVCDVAIFLNIGSPGRDAELLQSDGLQFACNLGLRRVTNCCCRGGRRRRSRGNGIGKR